MFLFAELHHSNMWAFLEPESNLINWLVLVGILAWLVSKYLPPVFKSRKEHIEEQLKAAQEAKSSAAKLLEEQKQKVANAEAEAKQILVEANHAAEQMRLQIEKQTEKDKADLLKKFEMALANERQMAVSQMRAVAVKAAMKLAQDSLRSSMTEQAQAKLLTQFVEQLDTISESKQVMPSNQFESIH